MAAANARVEAAQDDPNAVLVSLMGEVGLEYVSYRSLQQPIAPANHNLAAQQELLAEYQAVVLQALQNVAGRALQGGGQRVGSRWDPDRLLRQG